MLGAIFGPSVMDLVHRQRRAGGVDHLGIGTAPAELVHLAIRDLPPMLAPGKQRRAVIALDVDPA